jgi:hypothetical protein
VKRILICCAFFLAFGCDTDDRFIDETKLPDAGKDASQQQEDNVCQLSKCPKPDTGLACCTPLAQCGHDPSGSGLSCVPNSGGNASDLICKLADCPVPTVGIACCTPFAQCGFDPFSSGLACFSNPPDVTANNNDGGPLCDLDACPAADGGPAACCQQNGKCGVDSWGIGVCFAPPPPATDAAISSEPPDDPSVTGECPSYLGALGPIWGCCSDFGVCGTFANDSCLLPVGTPIPVPADDDEDAGPLTFPRCTPPAK